MSDEEVLFQSLSGFLMSCNVPVGGREVKVYLFQSLSGFLMSCNIVIHALTGSLTSPVSIPIGFSNEL